MVIFHSFLYVYQRVSGHQIRVLLNSLLVGTPQTPSFQAPSEPLVPKIGNENQEVPIDLIWLVYLPLWKIWVSWDDDIPNMVGKSFQPAMFQLPPSSFLFKQASCSHENLLRPIRPALNACQRLYQTLASSTVFSRGKVALKLIHENITWRAEKPFGRFWSGIVVWMGLMISIHIYIYMCIYIHSFVFCVCVYIYTSMCIHICVYIYTSNYVYIHTYTRIYMYICI